MVSFNNPVWSDEVYAVNLNDDIRLPQLKNNETRGIVIIEMGYEEGEIYNTLLSIIPCLSYGITFKSCY